MTEAPLVSVVIPAYNAAATLDETLRSVRSQTHRALEIIVINDGSTDDTGAIARRHAAIDGRVQVANQDNAGLAAARNAGWRRARSELIAFLDADDLWAPTKIERQIDALRSGGSMSGWSIAGMFGSTARARSPAFGRGLDWEATYWNRSFLATSWGTAARR